MKPTVISADVLFEAFRNTLRWEWVAGLGASERRFDEVAVRAARSGADLVGNTGTYVLDTRLRGSDASYDDISADTRSGVSATPGHPATGTINYSTDHDWIKTTLEAGKVYVLDVLAAGDGAGGTLQDATLRLIDASRLAPPGKSLANIGLVATATAAADAWRFWLSARSLVCRVFSTGSLNRVHQASGTSAAAGLAGANSWAS